jgi:hypothetical protein
MSLRAVSLASPDPNGGSFDRKFIIPPRSGEPPPFTRNFLPSRGSDISPFIQNFIRGEGQTPPLLKLHSQAGVRHPPFTQNFLMNERRGQTFRGPFVLILNKAVTGATPRCRIQKTRSMSRVPDRAPFTQNFPRSVMAPPREGAENQGKIILP